MMTWAECHAAGMTARAAAEERGRTMSSAYEWAYRNGTKWVDGRSMPVVIRGVIYASTSGAAEALGVRPQTISNLIRRHGHADTAGFGRSYVGKPSLHRSKATVFGRRSWPTRQAAAREIGMCLTDFYAALRGPGRERERLTRLLMGMDARDAAEAARALRRAA